MMSKPAVQSSTAPPRSHTVNEVRGPVGGLTATQAPTGPNINDTPSQKWIDSFHTGFNLQALRYFLKEGYGQQYQKAYEQGVKYYADSFFLEDGTPKYYHDKVYPIDIHAPAQAVVFFSSMGNLYRHLTDRVLSWMLENMYSGKGWFYFQKHKHYTNKISYMRWSQAWAFHALTEYILYCSEESGHGS